jgi:sugar transferase (PEP-CTERM system associated)
MAKMLMQRITWRAVAPIVVENGIVVAAVAASAYAYWEPPGTADIGGPSLLLRTLVVATVCQLCLYYADLYDPRRVLPTFELVTRLLRSLGVASLVLAAVYFCFTDLTLGAEVLALAVVLVIAALAGWRAGFEWLIDRLNPRERLLLIGTRPAALDLARELVSRRRELGVEIVGFIDPDPFGVTTLAPQPEVLGSINDIPSLVQTLAVDRVVVSLRDARGKLPMDAFLNMKLQGVSFDHLASVYEEYTGKIAIENLRPSWLVFSSGFRKPRILLAAKRGFDVLAACLGLVFAAPIMAVVALAIVLTSRGPVLYHQRRTGQHGRPFTLHKFRTMRPDAEAMTGPAWAWQQDPRTIRIGGFLRQTHLDELPQLWNVLRGEMSLVGPRPERPEFVDRLTAEIPFYPQRHAVKPGITGWAQVRYSYAASVEDAMEKLQYDLFYIKNLSLALDLFILFATVKTVLQRRGAR